LAAEPQQPAAASRRAIVFAPGIGDIAVNQSVATVGRKIADALDDRSEPELTFEVDVRDESYGDDLVASVCTISEKAPDGAAVPVLDVWKLDSVRELRRGVDQRSLLVKILLPALLLVSSGVLSIGRIRKPKGKGARSRFQFFYSLAILGLLTVYVGFLVYSALDAIGVVGKAGTIVPGAVVSVLTALGLWQSKLIESLASQAAAFVATGSYFRYGQRQDELVGGLVRLLQHLKASRKVAYTRVDLVAYSFGSIVALDAVFPPKGRATASAGYVDSLITVACPFDFVRTYWPSFFDDREVDPGRPKDWVNVYMPIDVLSSNFHDSDDQATEATVGIPTNGGAAARKPRNALYADPANPTKLGLADIVAVVGLRSHSFYWGTEQSPGLGVFSLVLNELYGAR
jgi:hypothetical protein